MRTLLGIVLPPWARWAALSVAGAFLYLFGVMHGERIAGQRHIDYVTEQSNRAVRIVQAQAKIVVQTEIQYRDRIKTIYVQGDTIEKEVPVYVTQTDNDRCSINAGFVRVHDAAWSGEPAGPAADSDRESAGISLAEVGEATALNATACHAWRAQALGLREFYAKLKIATETP